MGWEDVEGGLPKKLVVSWVGLLWGVSDVQLY